jgi:hypothetical protein
MKKYEIQLEDKTIPELSGFEYGLEVYKKQIGEYDFIEPFIVVFPDYIQGFAISFVQGFISEPLQKISRNDIRKYIIIKASKTHLVEEFYDNATY